MKKITKLTVGALAFAMFGLTSCVQDDVTPEVKEIYKNQLALLQAQTKVANARAAVEEAEARVKEATSTRDIARAEQQLIEQKLEHDAEVIRLQSQLANANNYQAATYANKYFTEITLANNKKEQLAGEEILLKQTVADSTDVVDKRQAVEALERSIAAQKSAIEDKKAEIASYEAYLSDTKTYENQVLMLQKKKDSVDARIEDNEALITKLEADRDAAQLKSGAIQISDNMASFMTDIGFGGFVSGSNPKKTTYAGVLQAKNGLDQELANYENNVKSLEKSITTNENKITAAFAPSGVAEGFTNRAEAQSKLGAVRSAKLADLTNASNTLASLEDLIGNYSSAIATYTQAQTLLQSGSTTIATYNGYLTGMVAAYNQAKTDAVANPNQYVLGTYANFAQATSNPFVLVATPPVTAPVNKDGQAGDLTDNPGATATYYRVATTDAGGNIASLDTTVSFNSTNTLPNPGGSVATPSVTATTLVGVPNMTVASGTAANIWFNVEADDNATAAYVQLDRLQTSYNAIQAEVERLTQSLASANASSAMALALINTYDSTTLNAAYDTAKAAKAAAQAAFNTADANYQKFNSGSVNSWYSAINSTKDNLADVKQSHQYRLANKAEFDALVAMATEMATDPKLAELKALEDQIAGVKAGLLEDKRTSASLMRQITYIKAFAEPDTNIVITNTYKDNMDAVKTLIKTCKTNLISLEDALEDAEAQLVDIKADDATAKDVIAKNVARIEARIAKLKQDIARHEALAAKYWALWEQYINA